jgi:hypothetical protein
MTVPHRGHLNLLSAVLQFVAAAAGGAWAGHAADPDGYLLVVGMLGMLAALVGGYVLSNVFGLVFAPVVMVQILRRARGHEPDAAARGNQRDYIGVAMIAIVVMTVLAAAPLLAVVVWLLATDAAFGVTLLRFVAVGVLVAALAPAARRVVV